MNKTFKKIFPVAFWLAVWQLVSLLIGKPLLFPGPWETLRCLFELFTEGSFWLSTLVSFLRIACGFLGGISLALLFFALSRVWVGFELVISSAMRLVRAVPVASFIVLLMLYSSYSAVPAIVSGLMVMPLVYANLESGLLETAAPLVELANAYKFGVRKKLKYVYIPSLKPYFRGSVLSAMGLAWKSGVAAEVIAKPGMALGKYIYNAKLYLETPTLFASTLVVVILSCSLEAILRRAFRDE